ncbi:MAG: O-antigen ligase family protein [Balneolaceae bacterium]
MSTTSSNIHPTLYERIFLRPLGLDTDNSLVLWLLLLAGTIMVGSLWYFEGDFIVTLSILFVVSIAVLSFLKPSYSLSFLVLLVLLFDQYGIPDHEPFTYTIDYFRNLKEVSYIPFFDGGTTNIIEIHLLLIILSLVFVLGVSKKFKYQGVPVWGACLFFLGCFMFSFMYGLKNGGDFLVAMWEVRALFYLLLLYFITPQLIRTRQQMKGLIWVFIIGITFKAFQAIYRFIDLGFTTGGLATLSNHEDPVFMVTLFILLTGFMVFKSRNRQLYMLIALLFPLLLGFYFGMRRAAYASMMVSFAVFVILLDRKNRHNFLKVAIPCFIGLLIYSAVFWNHQGRLGRPIQMVKTGFERPTIEENYEDYHSNLYREKENYNLAKTIENNPVIGTGFGVAYDQPVELFAIRYPLRDYIPHNEIIWVMVKMGTIGFFAFWFFFNSFVAKGIRIFSRLKDPYLKAVTLFIIIAVINQMVVSYFDLQLTYYRNMIYLGCLMGLLKTVETIHKDENSNSDKNENEENHSS